MAKIKILHTADLHLDSPFESLPVGKAMARRAEQRTLLSKIAALAKEEEVDLVLFSGDLLDGNRMYSETRQELLHCLSEIPVPIFIAPGNHDPYGPNSVYLRTNLPNNVYVFSSNRISGMMLREKGVRIFGAAFTDSSSPALLEGLNVGKQEGMTDLLCVHGEVGNENSKYNPITEQQLAQSGMDYVALGHVHAASGLKKAGNTWYSWPGCPEGRGFDEIGEKTVNIVTLEDGACELRQVSVALRKYEILKVNVTDADPLVAVPLALPDETIRDIYRIVLTGETACPINTDRLQTSLSEYFYHLELRDETKLRKSVWEKAGSDSLRGVFLEKLKTAYDEAKTPEERRKIEHAARWGLAAMDGAEEVVTHENS